MNEVRIKTKSPDIGVKPRAKQVQRERRAEAKLANEIIMCAMVGLLLLVSVLGVGDALSLEQCIIAWISIITGAEIARRAVKLNYLNTRR